MVLMLVVRLRLGAALAVLLAPTFAGKESVPGRAYDDFEFECDHPKGTRLTTVAESVAPFL